MLKLKGFFAEIKDFHTGHLGRAFVVDQGSEYLVHPFMLEIGSKDASISCRYYRPFTLEKEWEGWEYRLTKEDLEEDMVSIWKENFPG